MTIRTLLLTLLPLAFASSLPLHAAPSKPNIVLIVADDLGYRELGSYGQRKIRTPHLDRLATEGMRFTQAYAGSAVCAPSRCVLMTGRHPGHATVRNNRAVKPEGQHPIPSSDVTVAELVASSGYRTGAFGKWGLGPVRSTGDPLAQGFERFYGYNCQAHAHSYYPSHLWSDRERVPLENDPPVPGHAGLEKGADPRDPRSYRRFQGSDYAPTRILEQALEFVRESRDSPFFLYYPTVIPHVALHVPDEELAPYLALGWSDPPFTRSRGGYTPHFTPRAAYAAMITLMDRNIGRLLALLRELGLEDDTVVIFSSDNGTTHLNEEVDHEFFESVGELRGLKGSLHEGGVRVPLIVRWPGRVRPGSTSDRVVGFEDILPTLAELVGATQESSIDGISFVPTLLGEKQPERPFLYREFHGYGGQQSVRFGKWKAIRQNLRKGRLEIELYDLERDAGETRDVAREHPEIIERAKALLAREHTPSTTFPLPALDRS